MMIIPFTLTTVLTSVIAQSAIVPAPQQRAPVILEHATIHTAVAGASPLLDGFVVIDNGTIVAMGSGTAHGVQGEALPSNALRLDATGMHVTPGFISPSTTIGLVETLQVRATDDRAELGAFHPEVSAWLAVNPDSNLLPVARMGGVLMAIVMPQGGNVSGEASLIRLDGWTPDELAIAPDVGTVLRWPATEPAPRWFTSKSAQEQEKARRTTLRAFDDFFDSAKSYVRARSADPSLPVDLRFERLADVLGGDRPIFIEAASSGQIESAVLWAIARGMKPIIVGGDGAPAVADLLVAHKVPVIVQGVLRLPRFDHDDYDSAYTLPARLASKRIVVAITTGDEPSNDRNLVNHAAMAAAFGLPREEAIGAITRVPAQLAGVDARYGTIAVGRSGTLLLLDGDPLEATTHVQRAWLDGRAIELRSHQSDLKAKYDQKYALPDRPARENQAPATPPTSAPAPR